MSCVDENRAGRSGPHVAVCSACRWYGFDQEHQSDESSPQDEKETAAPRDQWGKVCKAQPYENPLDPWAQAATVLNKAMTPSAWRSTRYNGWQGRVRRGSRRTPSPWLATPTIQRAEHATPGRPGGGAACRQSQRDRARRREHRKGGSASAGVPVLASARRRYCELQQNLQPRSLGSSSGNRDVRARL